MDASQIGIVATSLTMARDLGKAMIGLRDANLVAEKVSALNEQLLKAQDALLAHNSAMFQLQNEYFKASEELRKLHEAARETGRYTLVDLGKGHLALQLNVSPPQSAAGEPVTLGTPHYICQLCHSNGRKVVLQRNYIMGVPGGLDCPGCKTQIFD